MINHYLIQKALRVKLLTLSVCTTGSVQISATASGYERLTGSFLVDGFTPGMEVTGVGFSASGNNAAQTITSVSALAIACPGCSTEAAGTRTLTVGLPAKRAWENVELEPVTGSPYVEETYLPGPMEAITLGASAQLEVLPLYVPKIYVPAGSGVGAARSYADAILELFAPRTSLTVSGHTVTVRTVPSPYSGQLLQAGPGWGVVPITIPLRVRTANSI